MCDTKKCGKCGKELPLDQFYKKKFSCGSIGYRAECKYCTKAMATRWARENPEKIRERDARSYKNNTKKHRARCSHYIRNRRAIDPEFKLITNTRRAINKALGRNTKSAHTEELLGCSIEYLRHHLENRFTEGMTWENYGRNGWHIDHIIPLSYFDFADPDQQKRAWHYTNLRPLWASDNIKKGNKIEEQQLILL